MWRLWFKGDAATRGTPYRRYDNWEIDCRHRIATKRVMVVLTQVAVESLKPPPPAPDAVLESMADDALMRLYDYVFPTFV
ncbi:hypothetical protein As57867_007448, partial [Aphanomyces stellatus]